MLPLEILVAELLVNHCMPTLLKVKPATMISVKLKDIPEQDGFYKVLCRFAGRYQCCCYLLYEGKARLYYMIYQEDNLRECLLSEKNKSFLISRCYQYQEFNVNERILEQLKYRYNRYFYTGKEFPHEMGVMLGYPLADVEGFIINQGRNYLLCGMWKVYQDVDTASRLFALYRKMREDAKHQLTEGTIFK